MQADATAPHPPQEDAVRLDTPRRSPLEPPRTPPPRLSDADWYQSSFQYRGAALRAELQVENNANKMLTAALAEHLRDQAEARVRAGEDQERYDGGTGPHPGIGAQEFGMLRTEQRLALDELCARDKEIDEFQQENRALKHQARGHMRRMESEQAHRNEWAR